MSNVKKGFFASQLKEEIQEVSWYYDYEVNRIFFNLSLKNGQNIIEKYSGYDATVEDTDYRLYHPKDVPKEKLFKEASNRCVLKYTNGIMTFKDLLN